MRRQLRAAAHNLRRGQPPREGDTVEGLRGYAAYVYMTDPKLGEQLLAAFANGRR